MRGVEAEGFGRHLAKRVERETDKSSGTKDPERSDDDNQADAEGGKRVSETDDGVRAV